MRRWDARRAGPRCGHQVRAPRRRQVRLFGLRSMAEKGGCGFDIFIEVLSHHVNKCWRICVTVGWPKPPVATAVSSFFRCCYRLSPSNPSPLPSPLPSFHWGTVSVRSTSTFRRSSWAASRPFQSTTPARTRFSPRRSSSTLSSSLSLPRFVLRHQPRQEGGEEVVEGFGLFSVGVCLGLFLFLVVGGKKGVGLT